MVDGYKGSGSLTAGRHDTDTRPLAELEAHRSHRSPSFTSGVRASPTPSWLSLVFKSFDSSIVRRIQHPSEPPIWAFAGDEHFTVPTSLMHADTLAPSSSLP